MIYPYFPYATANQSIDLHFKPFVDYWAVSSVQTFLNRDTDGGLAAVGVVLLTCLCCAAQADDITLQTILWLTVGGEEEGGRNKIGNKS